MPRHKEFNEVEVLEKAKELFWEKGFHATSMQDVVNTLGISRASIYDTYGDKMQLFLKAFAQYRKTSIEQLKTFLYSHGSVKEGLKKLFIAAAEEAESDTNNKGCFVVNTSTELATHDDAIKSIVQTNQKMLVNIFYDHLKTGVENGEVSKDKDLKSIALFLFTLNNGIKVLNRTNNSKKELIEMVESALSILD